MFKTSFASALAAPTPSQQFIKKRSVLATSAKVMGQGPFDSTYYLKGALAGGICCSITHGALCPVDVVKTRVQLDPVKVRTALFVIKIRRMVRYEFYGGEEKGLFEFLRRMGYVRGAWAAIAPLRAIFERGFGSGRAHPCCCDAGDVTFGDVIRHG